MKKSPTTHLQTILTLPLILLLSSCSDSKNHPSNIILTPTTLDQQATPTPQPAPKWPELITLKRQCKALQKMLRDNEINTVKNHIPKLAQSAHTLANTDLPKGLKNPDKVKFFQAQLLTLSRNARLSETALEKRQKTPEELRLYIGGVEYALRNMILQSEIQTP